MKKLTLLTVILFLGMNISAQYHSMLQQNHTWKCTNYGLIVMNYEFTVGPDSVDNSVIYKTLWCTYEGQDPFVYALMIEDTYTESVFIQQGNSLMLLYDFSLEVGDTANVVGVGMMHHITVTDVSTVQVGGTDRKKITFSEEFGPEGYWIEGVGSNFGPPDAALGLIMDYYPQLTCFYEDGELAWYNPVMSDIQCALTLNTQDILQSGFEIYPNPASDNIFLSSVDMKRLMNSSARIFNSEGKIIHTSTLIHNKIDIGDLPEGVYVLQILSQNQVSSQRFIKE